uniref:Uncharacterized protein n=1 Tax=Anguilla anguilla TaxID=7936 RepID=A0A0E9PHF3_ANGAN
MHRALNWQPQIVQSLGLLRTKCMSKYTVQMHRTEFHV